MQCEANAFSEGTSIWRLLCSSYISCAPNVLGEGRVRDDCTPIICCNRLVDAAEEDPAVRECALGRAEGVVERKK